MSNGMELRYPLLIHRIRLQGIINRILIGSSLTQPLYNQWKGCYVVRDIGGIDNVVEIGDCTQCYGTKDCAVNKEIPANIIAVGRSEKVVKTNIKCTRKSLI